MWIYYLDWMLFDVRNAFEQFLLACEADSRGRSGYEDLPDDKTRLFRDFFQAVAQVSPKAIVEQGYKGPEIAEQLRA